MSEMSTDIRNLPKPIKGAGLTNAGVVILQFLLILLFETCLLYTSDAADE